MKVIVFGANGGIGHHVVEQALQAGHQVTAVARRPESIALQHPQLVVQRGDVLDPASLAPLLAGQEAVVSALGARSRGPTVVYSDGVGNLLRAMPPAGVRRLLCISASGLDPGPLFQRLVARPLLWALLRNMYSDLVCMEERVRASAVDWTIIRPPRLTDGPRTGHYVASRNAHLPNAWVISRADLADYIITHLADPATYRAWVEVAHS
jgi:putative NADH-flavin reductase